MTPEEELKRTFAAAEQLHVDGVYHRWWPAEPHWNREEDPIGQDEFLAIVERTMASYYRGQDHEAGLRMAANRLFREGSFHIWWPRTIRSWEAEPVTRQEFLGVVERMVAAYKADPQMGCAVKPPPGPRP